MTDAVFRRLEDALLPACARAFRQVRANHEGERFYCIALYTTGEFAYVLPTAMTEEGLDEVVARYRQKPPWSEEPLETTRRALRWSPCDSPLHLEGESEMMAASEAVTGVSELLLGVDFGGAAFAALRARIDDVLCKVLMEMDARGVFGPSPEREQLVVTVMMGDQDDSILRYAERVNPPAVYERFRREWLD